MTPDELMAHRQAQAVAAANVDRAHIIELPKSGSSEAEQARRMAELRARNRVGVIPAQPGDRENLRVNSTVTKNERAIGSHENLNAYFRDVHGLNERGFKSWLAPK